MSGLLSPGPGQRPAAAPARSARRPGGACSRPGPAGRSAGCSPRRPPGRRRRPGSRPWPAGPAAASSASGAQKCAAPTGGEADADVGDGVAVAVEADEAAAGGDRPVAGPPLDLLVGAAAARPDRHPDLGEDLGRRRPPSRRARCGTRAPAPSALPSDDRITMVGSAARRPRPRGPRTGRPGTASRRSCPGCARSGRRSPARRRGRSGSARPATAEASRSAWRVIAPMAQLVAVDAGCRPGRSGR